ncbi:type II toxin-antitoxin system CcdA family antitoxin [Rhizobium sp. BR 314]|uniref:type II toxin-antitoxin system CcdA family antitoxin n=1 Tax=Rhizobium sp. BR 314 TaxID=3040013 RepID=UPI0039BF7AB0
MTRTARKAANLSRDEQLVADARELKINISRAAEDGITRAIKAERERLWLLENADAIEQANAYAKKHGLPFGKYRQLSWQGSMSMP